MTRVLWLVYLGAGAVECLHSPWLCSVKLPELELLKHEDLFRFKKDPWMNLGNALQY